LVEDQSVWIRIVAAGIGLIAMGVVAALGRNPAALPAAAYPVAETAAKADRLPLTAEYHGATEDTVGAASAAVVAAVTPPAPVDLVEPPPPPKPAPQAPPHIISRHWHDPAASKFNSRKRVAVSRRSQPVRHEEPKQVVEAKNCSKSGLDTFLRSVNLKPRC
jgi:hypothetical protein